MSFNSMDGTGGLPDGMLIDAMNTLPVRASTGDSVNSSPYSSLTQVRLEIVEQPKSRGFRFRYDCEGQSHGGLPGENSEKNRRQKTYPTVRLIGYRGRARVMVSLVTDTDPPMPHAHSIVGKNAVDGRCLVEIGPETDMYAQFTSLGILHVTKKKVPDVLVKRFVQQASIRGPLGEHMEIDQDTDHISKDELDQIKQQAQSLSKTMNLSVVRLCFQAYLPDEQGRFTIPVDPVFSHKVYDSKAPSAGTLKICRLDRTSGSVKGGDDIFLLCDKVQKNDIEVIFYEEKADTGMMQPWMAKGRFGPNDVHHQYAIVFQTPAFYNPAIEHPVQVWIALKRPSDQEISEPKPFLYLPQEFDEERIGQKRRKKITHFNNFFADGGGGAGSTGSGFFKDFGFGGGAGGGMGGGTTGGGFSNTGYNFFGSGGGGGGQGGGSTAGGGGTNYSRSTVQQSGFPGTTTTATFAHNSQSQNVFPSYQHRTTQPSHIFAATASSQFPPHQAFQQQQGSNMMDPMQQFMMEGQFNSVGNGFTHRGTAGHVIVKTEQQWDQDVIDRDSHNSSTETANVADTQESGVMRQKQRMPPTEPGKLGVIQIDPEDMESGFVESERLDSGLPTSITAEPSSQDKSAEIEAQQAMQALRDRQQMAFEVCDRMFNALLAWATTKDVRYLLAAQRSLTAVQNQEGDTALHLAIIHNHQDVVLQLLDVLPQLPPTETPVVDCLNNFKQSPLHLAVITRQHKVIQYLLKANASPLVCDRNGDTPLHLACKYGFLQGITPLLGRNNRVNTEGCRIPELAMRNNDGLTPLHLAAVSGKADCFKELVNSNADMNVQDSKSGKTALHYLVEKGDLSLTGTIVTEQSTNVECTDFSGNTPLHSAAAQGNSAIVSLLIAAGANLICQNQEGETPLILAEYGNHDEVVKVLKKAIEEAGLEDQHSTEQVISRMESVSLTQEQNTALEGDLATLDFRPRISLALLLDLPNEGKDWKTLASQLKLSHLIGGLQTMTSPTKELLNLYEAFEGTISSLRQALQEIGRSDAVNIIDRFLQEEGNQSPDPSSKGSFDPITSNPPSVQSSMMSPPTTIPQDTQGYSAMPSTQV